MVPFDDKSPFVTSGMRVGTAAVTTRGMQENDMLQIVDYIDTVLMNHDNETKISQVKKEINKWMDKFPLYV
jgi:glycine hydroxymethyltransferase